MGAGQQQVVGTTIKFNPPTGNDTMMKSGTQQSIQTRHLCITCMKEYENKSIEELRYVVFKHIKQYYSARD